MKLKQVFLWLGIMLGCFILVYVIMMSSVKPSEVEGILPLTIGQLKLFQALQTVLVFVVPTFICLLIYKKHPIEWLHLNAKISWKQVLVVVAFMIVAIPGMNLLLWLNQKVPMPALLDEMGKAAMELTEKLVVADSWQILLLNIFIIALLPAISEEICFRGTIQQYLKGNYHIVIWTTAIIFSAIHMQFDGFVPRMLLGAIFGYFFYWSGSLWLPILAHFTNNTISVLAYNICYKQNINIDEIDAFGTGDTLWVGILSCALCVILFCFLRRFLATSLHDDK